MEMRLQEHGSEPQNRSEAMTAYYPMVRRIANKTAATYGLPTGVDTSDLVSSGLIGLAEAWERFDASRGVAFEAYTVSRVRGAIIDAIRKSDWVPRKARQKSRLTGEPVAHLVSLDGGRNTETCPVSERIADQTAPEPGLELLAGEQRQELLLAVNRLPERERHLVSMHYFHGVQLAQVAREFGVTESRVSQLHGRALRVLREALSGEAETHTAA